MKTPFPVGKMGKWGNGKNVEQQYRKPTDAGKRVLKRQKPMVYGLQNTHIGMKTDRVIIEEQRKVTVKKQLVADDKYTAFFLPFLFIAYKYFVKTDFFHNFAPVFAHLQQYTGTATSQHTCLLADRQGTRDTNQDK